MMRIKQLFWELNVEIIKISLFRAFINAVIVFLLAYIALSFFNIDMLYALGASLLFLAVNTYVNYASITLKKIEDANPEVREMLRTARDTLKQDNIMVRALHEEIMSKARKIYTGNMMSYKAFFARVVLIGVLIIASLFISTTNFHMPNIPFDRLSFRAGISQGRLPAVLDDVVFEDTDGIFGESRVAVLGNEMIDIMINPSMSELDMNALKDEQGIELSRNSFPVDIGIPSGGAVSGQRKPEESELVNAFYMKKINT